MRTLSKRQRQLVAQKKSQLAARKRAMAQRGRKPATRTESGHRWESLVESFVAKGMTRTKALCEADKKAPGLRQAYIARANGRPVVMALYTMPDAAVGQNEVTLFGDIDESSAYDFKAELSQCDPSKPLVVRIDSAGGVVAAATSIYDAIERWPARTIAVIESNAYSCGSYVAMACNERHITASGMFMLHSPYIPKEIEAIPSDHELTAKLGVLFANAYAKHCRGGKQKVEQLLSRPEGDAWLSAQEALQLGFVTRIV